MINKMANKVLLNTMALYTRTLFLTIISLFSYRIVLDVLGAADYGTYNVVGGFVTMFAFISGTMTVATQRYFSVGFSQKSIELLNKLFSVNLIIYIILTIIILLLSETVGLWFITNELNLDYNRIKTIIIVYQTSIAVFVLGFLTSPFQSLLIADENMTIYSYISIVEGILKICVAYLLYMWQGDKLVIYSILMLFISILTNCFYVIYCLNKYKYLKFTFCKEISIYKNILSFVNWNLIGALAFVGKTQGINIIINIFFGTVTNAARAVAYQINSVVAAFSQNFMKAVDPRIVKEYSSKDSNRFKSLIYTSSKLSYYLLLFIALPFMLNAEYILNLWLVDVPDYTVIFVILTLIDALILSITDSILTGVQAIGKIKRYQLTVGVLSLINLPVSYVLLNFYKNPLIPFGVAIIIDLFITFGRLQNFKLLYNFSISNFVLVIIMPAVLITAINIFINLMLFSNAISFITLFYNIVGSIVVMLVSVYVLGLNNQERRILKELISFRKKDNAKSL